MEWGSYQPRRLTTFLMVLTNEFATAIGVETRHVASLQRYDYHAGQVTVLGLKRTDCFFWRVKDMKYLMHPD